MFVGNLLPAKKNACVVYIKKYKAVPVANRNLAQDTIISQLAFRKNTIMYYAFN